MAAAPDVLGRPVFRGDGEPAPPVLLNRLAEIEGASDFEPDSYSLGGSAAALKGYFAAALNTCGYGTIRLEASYVITGGCRHYWYRLCDCSN